MAHLIDACSCRLVCAKDGKAWLEETYTWSNLDMWSQGRRRYNEESKWNLGLGWWIRWVDFGQLVDKKVNSLSKSTVGQTLFFCNFCMDSCKWYCTNEMDYLGWKQPFWFKNIEWIMDFEWEPWDLSKWTMNGQ